MALNLSETEYTPVYRETSHYNPLHTFQLPPGQERHYQQQYGDMYFLRLAKLKPAVEEVAIEAWEGFSVRSILLHIQHGRATQSPLEENIEPPSAGQLLMNVA